MNTTQKQIPYQMMRGPSQAGSGIRPMMTSWESWKQIAAFGLVAVVCTVGACAVANPYGIAGAGVFTKLGMPSGCSEYQWDTLLPSNPINMVRPCKYWVAVGVPHQYWGYHELTDTIDDPTQFAPWVTAHPGKTWIIGNEPDLGSQDGLTTDQYARMFHCYYTFIKPLDPTAKFAIGAVTGGSTASGLTNAQNWYQQVLTTYQTLYGTNMPVDVWNVHSYCGPNQIEDPDKIINEFVSPFVLWCHTVQSGAYASSPVWITECPVGEWNGAMSPENVIYFMQRYLPRLEQAGIEKWFWYVSIDWDGNQGSCVLTDKSGQVTSVGSAYSALANSYPNAVPPIVPFVPYPTPETVLFDFSGDFGRPWFNKGGSWSNTNGELRHTGIYLWGGTACCPLYVYQDFGLNFKMKVNSAPTNNNWGAVLLRAASRLDVFYPDSGYLFFVRKNGEAGLYNKVDGIVVSVPGAVDDPTVYHNYQVYVSGFRIQCYIDGIKRIDWTDPNSRFASGYVSAQVYKADASFDDFALAKFPRPTPVVTDDGVYTTNLSSLHAAWDIADTNQTGFQYSVGLSAGATDVVPWTFTTDQSATPALMLNPASTYYVNVMAVYPGGILGPIASTDGITPSPCMGILNRDFEGGFSIAGGGYIANYWTEWEASSDVVIGYDEPSITHGGAHAQRIRVWGGTNGTSGGVYQRIPTAAGQPYTVSVWMYAGDALTACSLGVDPSGGINANSGVTWSSVTTNVAWVQKTWVGTATTNYLTVYYKVASADNVKRNGYFDDATLRGATAPLRLVAQQNGDSLTLTWSECPGARLERAGSLTTSVSWVTATNQVSIIGGQKTVTLTPTGGAGYFRLVLE
jgi:hypothetical protein